MGTGVGAVADAADHRVAPLGGADVSYLKGGVAVGLRCGPYVEPQRVRIPAAVPPPAVALLGAGHAQHPSPQHGHERRSQADVQTVPQLKLQAGGYVWPVEGLDHLAGGPRHRYERQEARGEEQAATDAGHATLRGAQTLQADCALHPQDGQSNGEDGQHQRDDHERPGGLHVGGQGQHGVVGLALEGAGALVHALHPQAPHVGHRRHDVGADVGRDLPVGQHGGHHRSQQPEQTQEESHQLQSC